VVTPVVDQVLGLPAVDPELIALLGISFGGYLASRTAAFGHRLAAFIANGGVFDFMAPRLPVAYHVRPQSNGCGPTRKEPPR
jgi:dipeptidyl aminopeptidase/acylaminoacyl peptidase